jgi:tetratricopeptide (TPR) repeat protein
MLRILPLSMVIAVATLAGCAVTPTSPQTTAGNRIDVDSYRLLADIALSNERLEEATDNYLNAAMASDDPDLAERAVQMAYRLGLNAQGHRAVARWRELNPRNPLVDYFSAIFEMRSGRVTAAVDDFSVLLGSLSDAELGSGYVLILDALNTEPTVTTAAQIMLELTQRFPGTREGHYGLAQLALRAGAFNLALDESRAAVELAPGWPDARLLYARTLLLAGRSEEALEIAGQLADQFDNTQIRLQFAELLLSAGETETAQNLLNEILEQEPGLPEAMRALAFLSLASNELDVAREQFETLRNNPDYRNEAFYYLGRIAEMEFDYLRATRAYSRVTDGVRAVEAQIRTGVILYEQMGDAEGALRHLSEFGAANPRFSSEMLLARAELLLDMDRAEDAIAMIDDAIGDDSAIADQDLMDAHVRFYSTLTENAISRSDFEAAEGWIQEGLARYPDDPNLVYSQARLLQEQGHTRRAVRLFEDLVEEAPNNAVFLNALGYLLTDQLDRHIEARGYIQRALAMNPESGAILDSMGWVLFRLGEFELALDYLERAYRALEVPEVMAHLIDVQWALGNQTQALAMLEQALTESPDDPYLTDVRDRLQQ